MNVKLIQQGRIGMCHNNINCSSILHNKLEESIHIFQFSYKRATAKTWKKKFETPFFRIFCEEYYI